MNEPGGSNTSHAEEEEQREPSHVLSHSGGLTRDRSRVERIERNKPGDSNTLREEEEEQRRTDESR